MLKTTDYAGHNNAVFQRSSALLVPNIFHSSLLKTAINSVFSPLRVYGCDIASYGQGHGSTFQTKTFKHVCI
jgi:hypothetical protein